MPPAEIPQIEVSSEAGTTTHRSMGAHRDPSAASFDVAEHPAVVSIVTRTSQRIDGNISQPTAELRRSGALSFDHSDDPLPACESLLNQDPEIGAASALADLD
ncbi:MAG TPA: hypothetical protein VH560_19055 [Polyangia bacterium]|nr:hypothetical protein [Polyangia bacterium]